jgi:hypothetical protein
MSKFRVLCVPLFLCFLVTAPGAEYTDGSIRLTLWEDSGRFSLYITSGASRTGYEPLFTDKDPRTSFLALMINDQSYKMGDSAAFKVRLGEDSRRPSLIFESAFLLVTQEFVFTRTPGASASNGVSVEITVRNRGEQPASVGLRFLLDTSLGEQGRAPPFIAGGLPITSETLIEKGSPDAWWVSGNSGVSLVGSISDPAGQGPDSVHFANWKRLNDAPWKTPYSAGRNFNAPPYSVGDSAVCYYFEPRPLGRGESRSFTVLLVAGDEAGLASLITGSSGPAGTGERERDLALIGQLIFRIDNYIAAGNIREEELASLEQTLKSLLDKYGPELRR